MTRYVCKISIAFPLFVRSRCAFGSAITPYVFKNVASCFIVRKRGHIEERSTHKILFHAVIIPLYRRAFAQIFCSTKNHAVWMTNIEYPSSNKQTIETDI